MNLKEVNKLEENKKIIIVNDIDEEIKCPNCNFVDIPLWTLNPDPDSFYYFAECDNCGIEMMLYPERFILRVDEEE